jgi:hypothetical protein
MLDLEITIAPITNAVKYEVAECSKIVNGEQVYNFAKAQEIYLRHSLKDIKGLKDYHGNEYSLSFKDESESELTDDCLSELFNIPVSGEMIAVCWQFMNDVPEKIINPESGKVYEGIELKVVSTLGGSV